MLILDFSKWGTSLDSKSHVALCLYSLHSKSNVCCIGHETVLLVVLLCPSWIKMFFFQIWNNSDLFGSYHKSMSINLVQISLCVHFVQIFFSIFFIINTIILSIICCLWSFVVAYRRNNSVKYLLLLWVNLGACKLALSLFVVIWFAACSFPNVKSDYLKLSPW